MELTPLLVKMVEQQASDLFISVGAKPIIKVEGRLIPVGDNVITVEQAQNLVQSILDDEKAKLFEHELELNMALNIEGTGRFRVNIYRQKGEPAMVVRFVKGQVPSLSSLGLPAVLSELIMAKSGLLLVVGGTGTGKSTTLASMIDYRNSHRDGHILTIEDPVEFIHEHKKSLVNQREVGMDTLSYENALKNALREAPDVIMIGEIRDMATMKQAISYAETGHLCLATLHANSSNQALERIINFFPAVAHDQLCLDLASHLQAIISQRLAVGINGDRVAAIEVMINTPFISSLIQKGEFDKIKEAMSNTADNIGQTFDDVLYKLVKARKISQEEGLRLADSRNNLALKLRLDKAGDDEQEFESKTVKYNKNAPFSRYKTFTITPLKVSTQRRKDAKQILDIAVTHCFEQKGYRKVEHDPDIDIQCVIGYKTTDKVVLELMGEEQNPLVPASHSSEMQASILINVIDCSTGKPVWRITDSRKLPEELLTQQEINAEFVVIMDDFPAAK